MWKLHSSYAAVAAAILAAACGGGDDGGTVTPIVPPPSLVQISMVNQDTVARAAIASILPFTSVSTVGVTPSPSRATAARADGASYRGGGLLTQMTWKAIDLGLARNPATPSNIARPMATYSASEPCLVSGSVTLTLDDKDNSGTMTPGDTLTFSFVQCSDEANSSINGVMSMLFSTVSSTPTATDMAGSMSMQQLVMIDQGATFSMNGGVSFHVSETAVTNGLDEFSSYTVASEGLTVTNSGSVVGYADTFSYRPGYTVTERDFLPSLVGSSETSQVTADGSFGSATLNGDLSLSTAEPFQLVEPDQYPHAGQMDVAGLNSTKLELTAAGNTQVRMDVCDDGDGVWEGTKMVDWSSLIQ
jgi:hypothetical protein